MTNLCFATEGLDGPISETEDQELVHEACKVLGQEKVDDLPPGGFIYDPRESTDSLEAIIAELPPWEECSQMLTMYSRRWYSMNDALFTPYWYESVEQLYATNFKSLRTPCQLAEIFGVLAITRSGQAVERGEVPMAAKFSTSEAARFAKALKRALEFGDYYEKPCFEAVRSLHLISTCVPSLLAFSYDWAHKLCAAFICSGLRARPISHAALPSFQLRSLWLCISDCCQARLKDLNSPGRPTSGERRLPV
jgi:hypothetical protein